MGSPIEVIRSIANRDDREQAIIFFLFFSRFEYALKREGYISTGEEARPDWQRYARERHTGLLATRSDTVFQEAVRLIRDTPPKKQKILNGRLAWEPDSFAQPFDSTRLVTLVCRIRNNLFHGGKFPEGPEEDVCRDSKLIASGLTVLQAFLDADEQLRSMFLEELT